MKSEEWKKGQSTTLFIFNYSLFIYISSLRLRMKVVVGKS